MTDVVTPTPIQHFVDSNGNAAASYQLFTYNAGTTTKQTTYTDSTGATANANPIVLNSRGEANIWLPPNSTFKFVFTTPTDSDPPTNAIWTVDSVAALGDLGTQAANNVSFTGGTITGVTLTDTVNQEFAVSNTELDATSNTTLATVAGLSIALSAGKTYYIKGHLTTSVNVAGGLKVALVASGGLTATSASFTGFAWNGTTAVDNTTVTALGSNITADTAVITDVYIDGAIVVNAAGTINVQAAQNASNANTTKVLINSTFSAVRIN